MPELTTHPMTVAIVMWYDAFSDPEMRSRAEAKGKFPHGLPMVTTGVVVDETDDSIMVAKDWITEPYEVTRNTTRIRKSDVQAIYRVTLEVATPDLNAVPVLQKRQNLCRDCNTTVIFGTVTLDGKSTGHQHDRGGYSC